MAETDVPDMRFWQRATELLDCLLAIIERRPRLGRETACSSNSWLGLWSVINSCGGDRCRSSVIFERL